MKALSKHKIFFFLTGIFFISFAWFIESKKLFIPSGDNISKQFSKTFNDKESKMNIILDSLFNKSTDSLFIEKLNSRLSEFENLYKQEGFTFFVLKENSLVFWSNNYIPISNEINKNEESELKPELIRFQNGWYNKICRKKNNIKIIGLILIKNEYPQQNNYLNDQFQQSFKIPVTVKISFDKHASPIKIFNTEGDFVCSLITSNIPLNNVNRSLLLSFLYITGITIIFGLIKSELLAKQLFKPYYPEVPFFITLLLLFRFLTLQLKFPVSLYELDIFSPVHFATSFIFPSLGDLLINAFLLLYICFLFHKHFNISLISENIFNRLLTFLVVSIPLFFSRLTEYLYFSLIENSNIRFDLTQVLNLSFYSYTGLFITGVLFLGFCLLSDKIILIFRKNLKKKELLFLILVVLICDAAIQFYYRNYNLLSLLWPYLILITIWRARSNSTFRSYYSFGGFLVIIFLESLFASYFLIEINSLKEEKNRTFIAQKLAQEKDPIAEFLFEDIETKLTTDTLLNNGLKNYWDKKATIDDYIKENYFEGYWGKYDIQITACDPLDSLYLNTEKVFVSCLPFFNHTIDIYGQKINNINLYFLNNNSGRISYLAKIPIPLINSNLFVNLFVEFDSKFTPTGSGYPELLLDIEELEEDPVRNNYSYAKYKNNVLITKTGEYKYSIRPDEFENHGGEFEFLTLKGMSHLLYNASNDTLIVLSKSKKSLLDKITSFSFLFAFFSLLMLIFLTIIQTPTGISSLWYDLKNRIPLLLAGTIILSVSVLSYGTIYYIKKQYKEKNVSILNEKTRSILIELEHKLSAGQIVNKDTKEYLDILLNKFSNVFFTDINLFDVSGNLIATSRKEVFATGLIDSKMNTVAYKKMSSEGKTEFIHEENIGKMAYLSAYVPFRTSFGNQIAYLNLPYFAKQNELENELSVFLATLLNIYVLIFVLSLVMALLISRYITVPLQLIKNKLKNIKLGKQNELIEWNGKDEIGGLIAEYNRMVEELTVSAQMLAQSERESAWREMAKQVAHEIKNPLTPIKLSVQHIERAWKDKAPDFDQRLSRFSKTLTEQIDTLTNIANEFSNFAKMPKAILEEIKLTEIIESVSELFKETEGIVINFYSKLSIEETKIIADKDQLIRVFNNLIKNALQSVPENRIAQIDITLRKNKSSFSIEIKDNGCGISSELRQNIFMPNFTTKTTGTGLGLAMVKNIIENLNGEIWFETIENKGTSFFVSLPLKIK